MKKYLLLIILINITNIYSQNVFQSNFDGVWKLKLLDNNNSSITFTDYVKFINNEIHFFNVESGNEKLLFIKKIEFKNNTEKFVCAYRIKFDNGEVWQLRFRNINNETRLIWTNTVDKDGNLIMQSDHRGILRNEEARKIALEGEINTYYIKIK